MDGLSLNYHLNKTCEAFLDPLSLYVSHKGH